MDNQTWSYFRGWTDQRHGITPRPEDYPDPDAYERGYQDRTAFHVACESVHGALRDAERGARVHGRPFSLGGSQK